MRRGFVCLLVVLCLLTGCADGYPEGIKIQCKDIQLTLPGDFIDLSDEGIGDGDFLYGRNTLIFTGFAEEKATLQEMTLDEYTGYVISGNKLTCTPTVYGDGYLFSYEATVDGAPYTYVTATGEGINNFWTFQFYCPSEDLEENKAEIDIILQGLEFQKNS